MKIISIFVILFLFINLRSALVLVITLPLIVLLGFIFMYYYGVRLERMTFAGLTIALGLIVDNSIIYVLRVHRLIQAGLPIDQALKQSNSRLLKPLLIAQLTTVAAFMPALLAKNKVTEFIQSLPLTVIFMLVAASFIRFFILPQLCNFFMRAHRVGMTPDSTGGGGNGFIRVLNNSLEFCFRHAKIMVIVFLASIPLAYVVYANLNRNFYKTTYLTNYLILPSSLITTNFSFNLISFIYYFFTS